MVAVDPAEWIALASEPVSLAVTHAQQYAQALETVEDAATKAMVTATQKHAQALTDSTSKILLRTLHPTSADLYGSSDWVNGLLADQTQAETLIRRSAQSGWTLGRQHVRTDAATLGFGPLDLPADVPESRWVTDAIAHTTNAYSDWRGKVQLLVQQVLGMRDLSPSARAAEFERLVTPINSDLMLRTSLGASTTVQRSHTDAMNAGAASLGKSVKKIWITNFSENTCGMCAALDGTLVDPEDEFDATASTTGKTVPVFTDLAGPPRHPNCACIIGLVLDSTPPPQVDTSTFQESPTVLGRISALLNRLRGK